MPRDFTFSPPIPWANGTTVSVYKAAQAEQAINAGADPHVAAVTTADVSGGALTVSVEPDTDLIAYAGGKARRFRATVDDPETEEE